VIIGSIYLADRGVAAGGIEQNRLIIQFGTPDAQVSDIELSISVATAKGTGDVIINDQFGAALFISVLIRMMLVELYSRLS